MSQRYADEAHTDTFTRSYRLSLPTSRQAPEIHRNEAADEAQETTCGACAPGGFQPLWLSKSMVLQWFIIMAIGFQQRRWFVLVENRRKSWLMIVNNGSSTNQPGISMSESTP